MGRGGAVFTLTSPPYVGCWARWRARARRRHVHWAMDLYPDVLDAHGMRRGFLQRPLEALARWQMRGRGS